MVIEIHKPELESLIRDRMSTGQFADEEDVLLQAMRKSTKSAPHSVPKISFAQLLLDSPLPGSGLDLKRQSDYPRVLEL